MLDELLRDRVFVALAWVLVVVAWSALIFFWLWP